MPPRQSRTDWLHGQLERAGSFSPTLPRMGPAGARRATPDEPGAMELMFPPEVMDATEWGEMDPRERERLLEERRGGAPPRRGVLNLANEVLANYRAAKEADNVGHYYHAKEVAATHAAGGQTAAQGHDAPVSGSGGTPNPAPPTPTQSGAIPGQTAEGYRSRMSAVRTAEGRLVFTNVPGEYGLGPPGGGPESMEAPGGATRVPYEEAIGEVGGSVSTPTPTGGGGMAYVQPESPPTVALESQPPMTEREIIEKGASMAAGESDPTDTRSIMERRAWTERRLAEERLKAMEEAEIAAKELAADPRFKMAMAEVEGRSRWGAESMEQTAEAERTQLAQALISTYEGLIGQAIESGDQESADYYEQILRMRLRGLGRTVPEPRAPGMESFFGPLIGETVDEKLEERKAEK